MSNGSESFVDCFGRFFTVKSLGEFTAYSVYQKPLSVKNYEFCRFIPSLEAIGYNISADDVPVQFLDLSAFHILDISKKRYPKLEEILLDIALNPSDAFLCIKLEHITKGIKCMESINNKMQGLLHEAQGYNALKPSRSPQKLLKEAESLISSFDKVSDSILLTEAIAIPSQVWLAFCDYNSQCSAEIYEYRQKILEESKIHLPPLNLERVCSEKCDTIKRNPKKVKKIEDEQFYITPPKQDYPQFLDGVHSELEREAEEISLSKPATFVNKLTGSGRGHVKHIFNIYEKRDDKFIGQYFIKAHPGQHGSYWGLSVDVIPESLGRLLRMIHSFNIKNFGVNY